LTTGPDGKADPVSDAKRAWDLLEMVAAGDIIDARAGSATATFPLLRDVAGVAIGASATNEQRDELAKVTMQRVRQLRKGVDESQIPNWLTTQTESSRTPGETKCREALAFAEILTQVLADELAKIGKTGAIHASRVSEKTADLATQGVSDPWRLWRLKDRSASFLKLLSYALWVDEVEPTLSRNARRRPAVVRAVVADRLLPAMSRQYMLPEIGDGVIRDRRGQVLGRIALTTNTTIEAVLRGAHALGSVLGHRLIRKLIHDAHKAWNDGIQDPRNVVISGGWSGLLAALNVSNKEHASLKALAIAGHCISWETEHAEHGGLWTWSERRGTKKAPGEVAFVLGNALAPGYADEMTRQGDSRPARVARRLVPELRFEPPFGGARPNEQGPIWTLQRLTLLHMVDHAEQLAAQGAVEITPHQWLQLASGAGVSHRLVNRTLDAWVAGDSETAPALLERVDKDAWTLATAHAPEREFIRAGGAERTAGRLRAGRKRKGRSSKQRT
jgi:hypothetical protein